MSEPETPLPSFESRVKIADKTLEKQKIKELNQGVLSRYSKKDLQMLLDIISLIEADRETLTTWKEVITETYVNWGNPPANQ